MHQIVTGRQLVVNYKLQESSDPGDILHFSDPTPLFSYGTSANLGFTKKPPRRFCRECPRVLQRPDQTISPRYKQLSRYAENFSQLS